MDDGEHPSRQPAASRARLGKLRARAAQTGLELERRFGDRRSVVLARAIVGRDRAVAGSELAGALAYRMFIWFLPFVLVLVAGLGVYSDASDRTPQEVAAELGLAGLVVQSVSAAATSSARWYALLIGVPVLLYLTRSLLRTVVAVHRLAWGLEPRRGHLSSANVLLFLAAIVVSVVVAAAISGSIQASAWFWLAVGPAVAALRAAVWLVVLRRLPARDHRLGTLLPGAAVVGAGLLAVNVFTQLVVVWLGDTREDTYGALGLAATILFSLWLASRVIVLGAVVNATVWSRRHPEEQPIAAPGRS